MALTTAIHQSLPYIDAEPTPLERSAAQSLIDAELSPTSQTTHPSLPPIQTPHFSPLIEREHQRIHNGEKLTGVDLSRYEAVEAPPTPAKGRSKSKSRGSTDASLDAWRSALAQAYTSKAYLGGRVDNLVLLEQFGKNAWLVGNSQLEDVLRGLEREVAEARRSIDVLAVERRTAQEAVGAEIRGLEEGWKRGVGRVLETQVAGEGLRREVLERRRGGA